MWVKCTTAWETRVLYSWGQVQGSLATGVLPHGASLRRTCYGSEARACSLCFSLCIWFSQYCLEAVGKLRILDLGEVKTSGCSLESLTISTDQNPQRGKMPLGAQTQGLIQLTCGVGMGCQPVGTSTSELLATLANIQGRHILDAI